MLFKTSSQHEKLPSQYSLLPENLHFNQSNKTLSEKEVIQPLLETLCYPWKDDTSKTQLCSIWDEAIIINLYTKGAPVQWRQTAV